MKPQLATGATAEAMAMEATVTGLLVTDTVIVLLTMAGIIAELIGVGLDIVGSAGVEVGSDVGHCVEAGDGSPAVFECELNSTPVD